MFGYNRHKQILTLLQEINSKQDFIISKIHTQMALLDKLTADVAALTTVDQSAIALLNGLSQAIKDAGTDPVALQALTDQIESQTASLAGAVTANTPTPPVASAPIA